MILKERSNISKHSVKPQWQNFFALLNASKPRMQLIKALDSINSSRSYEKDYQKIQKQKA